MAHFQHSKNKYLDNLVWVRETRAYHPDLHVCSGAINGPSKWFITHGLLEAVARFRPELNGYVETHYEFWLNGCEQISSDIVYQFRAWSYRLRWQERARERAALYPRHPGAKPRGSNYFRSPKTTAARRQAQALAPHEEGYFEPAPRAKQNAHNLPNSWDDYPRGDREDRNWKRFRKHQYKKAEPSFRGLGRAM